MTANITLLKPRDYQLECIRAIHTDWAAGTWRPASVLPTGAGKTVVFSHLAEEFLTAHPDQRVLVLSHTDELVLQAADKMRQVAPHRTVGIVKAERNEVTAQVISASVQSLRSASRRAKLSRVGLIIVDECHHAVAKTYQTILRHFGALSPEEPVAGWAPTCRVAGFTATLVRADQEKLSDVWEKVAFRRDIAFMIRRGYLLDVKGRRVVVPTLDLKTVKTSGGDFQEGALADALEESFAPEIVAKAYLEHASDRKGLVFAPTVESAYLFEEAFRDQGITAETVHGALGRDERRAILARLRSGETQVVCNCMVLTEGFDDPTVSCAVIARPTKSSGLYQQMVGRVLRPDLSLPTDQRGHALILDVVGISRRHDLRSLIDLSAREDLKEKDLAELEELEDLSLLELEDLEEVGQGSPEPPAWYVGGVDTEDFDPLARDSARTWGKTPAGTYWMPAGDATLIFLAESVGGEPGAFDVVWCSAQDPNTRDRFDRERLVNAHGNGPYAGMTEHRGLSFEMALSWAEEVATEMGGHGAKTLSTKSAKWRKDPATSGQVWKARRVGVEVPVDEYGVAQMTKGEVSDAIGRVLAGRRIDPLVQAVMAAKN